MKMNQNGPLNLPKLQAKIFVHIELDPQTMHITYSTNAPDLIVFKGMLGMIDSLHTRRNEQPVTTNPIVVAKPM